MTQTNDDKLKEELWEYYNNNEQFMDKFIDYIIKKAREGYVKKEELEVWQEQKCGEIEETFLNYVICNKKTMINISWNEVIEEAKKIIRG